MGDLLIVWSARIVVLFYFLRVAVDFLVADPQRRERWALGAWTVGCAVFLLHIAFAFQFLHGWSHASAVAHTARRTYEVIGINWGGGIYVNYAFMLLWVVDVAWWWRRYLRREPTPARHYWSVQAIFAFMTFNATVVFGPPHWKWTATAAVLTLLAARMLIPKSPAPDLRQASS